MDEFAKVDISSDVQVRTTSNITTRELGDFIHHLADSRAVQRAWFRRTPS